MTDTPTPAAERVAFLSDEALVDLLEAVGEELRHRTQAAPPCCTTKVNAFASAYCGIGFHVAAKRKVTG